MDAVLTSAEVLIAVLLVVVIVPVVWLTARRRWLSRQGGMFDCAVRLGHSTPGTGWVLGVARYRAESLQWFRALGLSFRPGLTFDRAGVRAGAQRTPTPVEAVVLFDGQRIVELLSERGSWELAMAPDSLTGLLSWLEAAPPGTAYRARLR